MKDGHLPGTHEIVEVINPLFILYDGMSKLCFNFDMVSHGTHINKDFSTQASMLITSTTMPNS